MSEGALGFPYNFREGKRTLRTFTGMEPRMLTVQQYVMKDHPASNANSAQVHKHLAHGPMVSLSQTKQVHCFCVSLKGWAEKTARREHGILPGQGITVQILWVVSWSPPHCALQSCLLRHSHLASAGSFQCQADPTSTSLPSALLLSLTRTSKPSRTRLVGCPSQGF